MPPSALQISPLAITFWGWLRGTIYSPTCFHLPQTGASHVSFLVSEHICDLKLFNLVDSSMSNCQVLHPTETRPFPLEQRGVSLLAIPV